MSDARPAAALLDVRLCGAIRPLRQGEGGDVRGARLFMASGILACGNRLVRLSVRETQVLGAIVCDRSRRQRQSIIAALTVDDDDGGPETIDHLIGVYIMRLRAKLAAVGLGLERDGNQYAPLVLRGGGNHV